MHPFSVQNSRITKLNSKHFLEVHDAVKAVYGEKANVVAHITERHKFQANMSALLPQSHPDVFDLTVVGQKLRENMPMHSVKIRPGSLYISFKDSAGLFLTVGPQKFHVDDLSEMKTEDERRLYRGTFGADNDLWIPECTDAQIQAAKTVREHFAWQVGEETVPPINFWLALTYRFSQEGDIFEEYLLENLLKEKFFDLFPRPTFNPALPEENLNGYQSLSDLLAVVGRSLDPFVPRF